MLYWKLKLGGSEKLHFTSEPSVFVLLFQPPPALNLANFKGCIELDSLNEEVLSLYNFENIIELNTTEEKPCGRSVWHLISVRSFT